MEDKFSRIWGDLLNRVGTSTIRECSYGGAKGKEMHLVDSTRIVIEFDYVSEELAKELNVEKPTSVDALYIQDGKLCLVEFKNTDKFDDSDKKKGKDYWEEVKMKIHDTLVILQRFDYISWADFPLIQIIVVRKFNSKDRTRVLEMQKAGKTPRLNMKLNFLQKAYQTNIFDMNPDEYKKLINTPNDSEVVVCTQ